MTSSASLVFFFATAIIVVGMHILFRRIALDLFESSTLNKVHTDHYGYREKATFIGSKAVFREIRYRHPRLLWGFYLYCLIGAVFLYVSAT